MIALGFFFSLSFELIIYAIRKNISMRSNKHDKDKTEGHDAWDVKSIVSMLLPERMGLSGGYSQERENFKISKANV